MYRRFAVLSLVCVLGGCTAAEQRPTVMQPVPQPMTYREPAPGYSNPGSIFNESDAQYLYADSRARRVGDIVMINVVESSSATSEAETKADRDSETEYGVTALFGRTKMPLVGGTVGNTPLFGTSVEKSFDGKASTTRANKVTATVAARVINVMPDGLLQVEGARETKVNNETQYLVVSGLIRSRDVARDNSIMSTQMADAQIAYYGKGVVADKQKPGWFTRLMDHIWPF
ncbi:MAG: flagellar basal body L-ring protein FlgH [Desulfovibrionaceae bacterium]|nr:flagellar basal body L-ring protein FlgH [Desulfovibrionaceae bacterium]